MNLIRPLIFETATKTILITFTGGTYSVIKKVFFGNAVKQLLPRTRIIDNICLSFVINAGLLFVNKVYKGAKISFLANKLCLIEIWALAGAFYQKQPLFFFEFQLFPVGILGLITAMHTVEYVRRRNCQFIPIWRTDQAKPLAVNDPFNAKELLDLAKKYNDIVIAEKSFPSLSFLKIDIGASLYLINPTNAGSFSKKEITNRINPTNTGSFAKKEIANRITTLKKICNSQENQDETFKTSLQTLRDAINSAEKILMMYGLCS